MYDMPEFNDTNLIKIFRSNDAHNKVIYDMCLQINQIKDTVHKQLVSYSEHFKSGDVNNIKISIDIINDTVSKYNNGCDTLNNYITSTVLPEFEKIVHELKCNIQTV